MKWIKAIERTPVQLTEDDRVFVRRIGSKYKDCLFVRYLNRHPHDYEWLDESLPTPLSVEEIVKQIASVAWKGAANAHRMYPENKHTFTVYWDGAKEQFNDFISQWQSKQGLSSPDDKDREIERLKGLLEIEFKKFRDVDSIERHWQQFKTDNNL